MRITSTGNVGIGTSSPAGRLAVVTAGTAGATQLGIYNDTDAGGATLQYIGSTFATATRRNALEFYMTGASSQQIFYTNATERMRLDSSGNLGLGVTPSAWYSTYRVLEGANGSLYFRTDTVNDTGYMCNAYRDTGATYRFKQNGAASYYGQGQGQHQWFTSSSSGTAGNAITFTQAMTLDASGRLLVGRTTQTGALRFQVEAQSGYSISSGFHTASTQSTIEFKDSTTTADFKVRVGSAGDNLLMFAGGSERMRIDSSGNLLVGTATASTKVTVNLSGANDGITLRTTNEGAIGLLGMVNAGSNNDIQIGTLGNNNLRFFTNGTANERMRIDSSGNLLVGANGFVGSGTTRSGLCLLNQDSLSGRINIGKTTSGTRDGIQFNHNGTTVGTVTYSDTATTYGTSSDYRLKENIAPMTGALDKVSALKPVTYTWKVDGSAGEGFIAHELAELVPDCVTGEKDAVDADGKPQYQGIDTSFLVATLTAAIQELKAEVDALKAQINQ
jgi:hypothetical protein